MTEISLSEYDTVVAVTQIAINEALAEWMEAHPKQVALYYVSDGEGGLVPSSKEAAEYLFEGTLAPATDENKKPVDFVTLYSAKGPQTVQYNVVFSGARFECKPLKFVAVEKEDKPWVMRFDVDLALEKTALERLPQKVREEIEKGVLHFDEDTFSIQRLWADLTTAALSSFEGIEGLTGLAQEALEGLMRRYLAEQQERAEMIFGCAVLHTAAEVAAPTFTPTALDFCVTPYQGEGGKKNPALDTLNYLVMTEARLLPKYPPTSFPFNWVEDASVAGRVAVRGSLFGGFLLGQLAPILPQVSPTVVCDANAGGRGEIRTSPSAATDLHFSAVEPAATGGTIGNYSYQPPIAPSKSLEGNILIMVKASYRASAQVAAARNLAEKPDSSRLLVSGQIVLSGSTSMTMEQTTAEEEIPPTTWSWKAELQLSADLNVGGQLRLKVSGKDFASPPTVEKHEQSFWLEVLEHLAPHIKQSVEDFGGIRQGIETTSLPAILTSIEKAAAGPHHFVFPGAKTFVYSNPGFGGGACLVADIAYQGG